MVLFALCSSSQVTFWTVIRPEFSVQSCSHSSQGSIPISSHPGLLPNTFWSLAGWLHPACPALPPWALLLELQMSLPPLAPWVLYIAIVSGTKPFLDLFHCIIWVLPAVLSCILEQLHRNHHTSPRSLFLSSHYIQFLLFSSYLSHCGFIFWSWL